MVFSKQSIHFAKNKHLDLQLHFISELEERAEVELKNLQTDLMIADALTKGLGKTKNLQGCPG